MVALNLQIDSKSMPLGFKWPGKEPDPQVACDSQDCQITPVKEDANIVMRMACGHAFHEACSIKNQVQTGCPVYCPLLKAEVKNWHVLGILALFQKGTAKKKRITSAQWEKQLRTTTRMTMRSHSNKK